ncbi:MAG: four-carbon acid sugar kinase family protein [Verrucomicrobiota bacterium]
MPGLGIDDRDQYRMTYPELLASLPPEWPHELQPSNREALLASGVTLVVLDDDPTGTQTVHDVPVLTCWDVDLLEQALRQQPPLLFLLTNSRSLTEEQTQTLHREIAQELSAAAQAADCKVELISRSDSTLRGHYPLETDTLAEHWHEPEDLTLVMPFFLEGGRLTVDGQHYVREGEELIPAHETPFAQDPAFAFSHSYLPDWVEEKTDGRVQAAEVILISIETIRKEGPEGVARLLREAPAGSVCITDAVSDRDAEVVAAGMEAAGRTVMARTAASYVRARAGLPKRELLSCDDLDGEGSGGLIMVGSHVPKTTRQLEVLQNQYPDLVSIELPVADVLADAEATLESVSLQLNAALEADQEVVLFTSRELIQAETSEANLDISVRVSGALVRMVQSIGQRPRFIVSKGGITSSDIATGGLEVKTAEVAGSILPGVPVWRLGEEARFPGMHYVIFPGNVGDENAVADAVSKLSKK